MSHLPRSRQHVLLALASALILAMGSVGGAVGADAERRWRRPDHRSAICTPRRWLRHWHSPLQQHGERPGGRQRPRRRRRRLERRRQPPAGQRALHGDRSDRPGRTSSPDGTTTALPTWRRLAGLRLQPRWRRDVDRLDRARLSAGHLPRREASPLFGTHTDAGDPIAAFDNDGNLFVGGIASTGSSRRTATCTSRHTARTRTQRLSRSTTCGRSSSARARHRRSGRDLPGQADARGRPHRRPNDGNVYVCWSRFTGATGRTRSYFSRSTDPGRRSRKPIAISRSEEIKSIQGCDIAIEGDGDVYVTFRTSPRTGIQSTGSGSSARPTAGRSFRRRG